MHTRGNASSAYPPRGATQNRADRTGDHTEGRASFDTTKRGGSTACDTGNSSHSATRLTGIVTGGDISRFTGGQLREGVYQAKLRWPKHSGGMLAEVMIYVRDFLGLCNSSPSLTSVRDVAWWQRGRRMSDTRSGAKCDAARARLGAEGVAQIGRAGAAQGASMTPNASRQAAPPQQRSAVAKPL